MSIRANVERSKSGAGHRVDCGEVDFVVLPRIGERVTIDSSEKGFTKTESGLVSGIEHLIDVEGSSTVMVFVDFEFV